MYMCAHCCCMQNGKRAAFALLDECQQLGATAAGCSGTSPGSRLLVGLQEGVQQLASLGSGVEVITSQRR